jgi:hypothetical protein
VVMRGCIVLVNNRWDQPACLNPGLGPDLLLIGHRLVGTQQDTPAPQYSHTIEARDNPPSNKVGTI